MISAGVILGERMRYAIIRYVEIEELVSMVNEKITEGWKPLGGIAIAERGEENCISFLYVQAMVLNEAK